MPAFEEDSIRRFEIVLEALVFRASAHGITASREHLARRLFDVVRAGFKDTEDLIEQVLKRGMAVSKGYLDFLHAPEAGRSLPSTASARATRRCWPTPSFLTSRSSKSKTRSAPGPTQRKRTSQTAAYVTRSPPRASEREQTTAP